MAKGRRPGGSNTLRIIGGKWRGRKLRFADGEGLRPTTDRVRETLFNWLQPVLEGARCLDLFAGSGALGLEALSRGAREVVFVDTNAHAVRMLKENLSLLQSDNARVVKGNAQAFLQTENEPFDIVFLDPPFRRDLLQPILQRLAAGHWLAPGAHLYLELESELGDPDLPEGWYVKRSKRAGQVAYHLVIAGE